MESIHRVGFPFTIMTTKTMIIAGVGVSNKSHCNRADFKTHPKVYPLATPACLPSDMIMMMMTTMMMTTMMMMMMVMMMMMMMVIMVVTRRRI